MSAGSDEPYSFVWPSAVTVMPLRFTVSVCWTDVAAEKDELPAWLAVIVAEPALRTVAVLPEMLTTVGSELT